MDVIAHRPQIAAAAALDVQRLVTSREKVSALLMPEVEALGVNPQQPLHPDHQVGLGRFDDQMKMIAHEAIGVNLPLSLVAGFGQGGQEYPAVLRIAEDFLPAIPPVHHMVDRSGKFMAHLAWHIHTMPPRPAPVNQFKK